MLAARAGVRAKGGAKAEAKADADELTLGLAAVGDEEDEFADVGEWSEGGSSSARSASTARSDFFREVDLEDRSAAAYSVAVAAEEPDAAPAPDTAAPPKALLIGGTERSRHQLMLTVLVGEGKADRLKFEVTSGADVNLPDDSGRPPLLLAAMLGQTECVTMLLGLGADINGRDRLGNTALHVAAQDGRYELVQLMVRRDSEANQLNIDAQTFSGRTALHLAAQYGHLMTVEVLCTAGCALDSLDRELQTPEQLARAHRRQPGDAVASYYGVERTLHEQSAETISECRISREAREEPEEDPDLVAMRADIEHLTQR
jgi:hypothetical protein